MTTSPSRLAFNDCFDVFDQALADPFGIRIAFTTEGLARHFRTRLHQARIIDRSDNATLFTRDQPMHGRSVYDPISAKIREVDGKWYIYLITLNNAAGLVIESLEGKEIPAYVAPPKPEKPVVEVLPYQPMAQITFRRR